MKKELARRMLIEFRDSYLPTSKARYGGRRYPEEDFGQFNSIVSTCGLPKDLLLSPALLEERMTSKNLLEDGHELFSERRWIGSSILDRRLRETIDSLAR